MRPLGEQRLAAPGGLRRRSGLFDVDDLEDQRPRPRQLHAEHGLRAARLSLHGGLDRLWAGQSDRQPADVRRDARRPGAALQQSGQLLGRLFAGETSRDDHPPAFAQPDRRSVSAQERHAHHCRERTRRPGLAGRSQSRARTAMAGRFAARSPDRLVRTGRANAAQRTRGARRRARNGRNAPAVWTRREADRGLWPQLPDRAAAAGARRAVRAGLERRGGPDGQLGQPRQHRQRTAADGAGDRQAVRGAGQGSQSPRDVRRHAGHLDDRVRPHALQPGSRRPRPQRRHVRQLAGRRRHQAGRRLRPERRMGLEIATSHLVLRPARHDPAPAGHRPHPADLSLQRRQPPADRRAWPCDRADSGLRLAGQLREPVLDVEVRFSAASRSLALRAWASAVCRSAGRPFDSRWSRTLRPSSRGGQGGA